jgi:membrane-associated phospholipid phosphatase
VGASRLTENKHFASDIAFGAGVGVVAGHVAAY